MRRRTTNNALHTDSALALEFHSGANWRGAGEGERKPQDSMNRTASLTIAATLGVVLAVAAGEITKHSAKPKDGFVPDAKTAIKIAVAVWEPIYGEKEIAREKPYRARLDTNDVWIVEGSLRQGWFAPVLGGVAVAEIAKGDGRILRVSHGK